MITASRWTRVSSGSTELDGAALWTAQLTGYVTLAVDNPTEFDLAMEKNRLVIAVDGAPWWEGSIPTLRRLKRSETRVKVPFEVTVTAAQALEGPSKAGQMRRRCGRVSEVFKRMDSPASVVDRAERTIAATQLRFEAAPRGSLSRCISRFFRGLNPRFICSHPHENRAWNRVGHRLHPFGLAPKSVAETAP